MEFRNNEDLVQEAMTIIYEKYKDIELEKGILPWAYKIVDNVMQNDYKTELRRMKILSNDKNRFHEIYGSQEDVEEKTDNELLVNELKMALRKMSKKEKKIFELKLKELSGTEIQNRLGISRSNMDVIVFRGIRKLRRILEKRGVV